MVLEKTPYTHHPMHPEFVACFLPWCLGLGVPFWRLQSTAAYLSSSISTIYIMAACGHRGLFVASPPSCAACHSRGRCIVTCVSSASCRHVFGHPVNMLMISANCHYVFVILSTRWLPRLAVAMLSACQCTPSRHVSVRLLALKWRHRH